MLMLKNLNDAVEYIERHFTEDISSEDVADYVGESDFHFKKIFQALAGISLNQYIKQRKFSVAGQALFHGETVTDIAFKFGYQSVEGFSRSFKSWCGFLPSEVKKNNTILSFPKLTFYIDVKGGETMETRIVEMPAFQFAGVQKRVPIQFEGVNHAVKELADSITDSQREEMRRIQNINPRQIVNVSYDADENFIKEEGRLTHMIGVLTTHENIKDCLETINVPANTWAVFPNEGPFPETLQNTMAQIAAEWFPSSNFEQLDVPGFSFTEMSQRRDSYAYSEVWVPVKKKENQQK